MRPYLGLVGYEAVFAAVGYALLVGTGVARLRLSDVKLVGLALFSGWELLGVTGSLLLMLGFRMDFAAIMVLAGVLVVSGAVGRGFVGSLPRPDVVRRSHRGLSVLAVLAAAILVLACAAALVLGFTGGADLEWDSWAFWAPKAEVFYYSHGIDNAVATYGSLAHPEYPPLWPLTAAGTFVFAGGFHPALLPLQQTFVGVSFVAAVAVLAARRVPAWLYLPAFATVVVAPGFWWRLQTFLPDQTVACSVAVAAVCSLLWLHERRGAWLVLAVVSLAAAALTKLEGVTLGIALALAIAGAAVVQRGRRGLTALWLALGPAAIIPWRIWLDHHGLPVSSPDYALSRLLHPLSLAERAGRLELATRHMLDFSFGFHNWLLVMPLAAVMLAVAAFRLPASSIALGGWAFVCFLGFAAVYWIGKLEIHYFIATSADRVTSTLPIVVGTAAPLLLGMALGSERETQRRNRRSLKAAPAARAGG